MSLTCHRCGAVDPVGNVFRRERIPFRGARIYCPPCHKRFEDNFLAVVFGLNVVFAIIGIISLWRDPSSETGHVFTNVALIQLIIVASTLVHEFAHALVGRACGLRVLRMWIGRGKTLFRASVLGFDTEFKMIPFGGLTFLTPGSNDRLRLKYFLSVLAGPAVNVLLLILSLALGSHRSFDLETTLPISTFILIAQISLLLDTLLPYRVQTSLGTLCSDGLSLFRLLTGKPLKVLQIDTASGTDARAHP